MHRRQSATLLVSPIPALLCRDFLFLRSFLHFWGAPVYSFGILFLDSYVPGSPETNGLRVFIKSRAIVRVFILMKFLLGTKEYMTQIFDEDGTSHGVTVLSAGPVVVTQVKNTEKDGYRAVQVGYAERREKNINKAQLGHLKGLAPVRYFREFRATDEYKRGDTIDLSIFTVGDVVEVSATSKGKGFQGVIKRHGFKGGPRTHGQKHSEREPGSIGSTGPQRVLKGTKMGGRMGGERVTVKNLKVLQINKAENLLVLKGAVPGRRGSLVEIRIK